MIWQNPMPLGQGRRATLVVIMKAMLEGKDFSAAHKLKINEMWLAVLAEKKKLEDFKALLNGKEQGQWEELL